MSWYTVRKKINGHVYIYRQRTYREGGKVRTEGQYLGPAGDASGTLGDFNQARVDAINRGLANARKTREEKRRAAGRIAKAKDKEKCNNKSLHTTTLSRKNGKRVTKRPNTKIHPALEPIPQATLRIQKQMRHRNDISETALIKEEERVCAHMEAQGLITSILKPVRVWQERTVRRHKKKDGYYVYAAETGQRTLFKRTYRETLAARWLDALKEQNPKRYAGLREWMDREYRIFWKASSNPVFIYLVSLWKGDDCWRKEAEAMAGEMIQRGTRATYERYSKEVDLAEKEAEKTWRKFKRLKRPSSRKKQYEICKQADAESRRASARHGEAIWVRYFLFGERPNVNTKSTLDCLPISHQ